MAGGRKGDGHELLLGHELRPLTSGPQDRGELRRVLHNFIFVPKNDTEVTKPSGKRRASFLSPGKRRFASSDSDLPSGEQSTQTRSGAHGCCLSGWIGVLHGLLR